MVAMFALHSLTAVLRRELLPLSVCTTSTDAHTFANSLPPTRTFPSFTSFSSV